nr:putative metallothionin 2 [Ipomoea batatas]
MKSYHWCYLYLYPDLSYSEAVATTDTLVLSVARMKTQRCAEQIMNLQQPYHEQRNNPRRDVSSWSGRLDSCTHTWHPSYHTIEMVDAVSEYLPPVASFESRQVQLPHVLMPDTQLPWKTATLFSSV